MAIQDYASQAREPDSPRALGVGGAGAACLLAAEEFESDVC
jgi:hypothetical protein